MKGWEQEWEGNETSFCKAKLFSFSKDINFGIKIPTLVMRWLAKNMLMQQTPLTAKMPRKFGRTSDNMKLAPDCIKSPENIDVALLILSINILSSDLLKVS